MMPAIAAQLPSSAEVEVDAGPLPAAGLDIHGFRVALRGWPEVVEQVALDFAFFREPEAAEPRPQADIELVVERAEPDFSRFGALEASFVTPRNVVHQADGLTVIDYFGRALSVFDRSAGRLAI
jgi:hypothetical protein